MSLENVMLEELHGLSAELLPSRETLLVIPLGDGGGGDHQGDTNTGGNNNTSGNSFNGGTGGGNGSVFTGGQSVG